MTTDMNTDIGCIAEADGYGMWVESGSPEKFMEMVDCMVTDRSLIKTRGERVYSYLCENYTVQDGYQIIMGHFK